MRFLIGLLILFVFLSPLLISAAGTTLTVNIVYKLETHSFNTSSSFSDSIGNPNDPDTYCDFESPADALSSGDSVTLTVYSTSDSAATEEAPLPSDKEAAKTFYNFSFENNNTGSAVTSFDKAITLTCYYSDSDIGDISDESTIVPYRWDGSEWVLVSGATLDTDANKVTFSSSQFSFIGLLGSAPSSSDDDDDGGGGGSSSSSTGTASIVFSGRAYPRSTVTVLREAQVAGTAVAGPDARFSLSLTGLSAKNYTFSLYSEDAQGRRSSLLTFSVGLTAGVSTAVGGIFIAPTIDTDKLEVRRGDNLAILGQSAPRSEITISVASPDEFFFITQTDASGAYLYNLNSAILDYGDHFTKSKTAKDEELSTFSRVVNFVVGTKNVLRSVAVKAAPKGDLNGDGRVNLIDFSIAAFWYKRALGGDIVTKEANLLNGDGRIDLVDFSIMAFYWTG